MTKIGFLISGILLPCTIEYQIEMVRPGASYIIHSGDYSGIEWTDKSQTKPTRAEIDQAFIDCQNTERQKVMARDQLKTDLNTTSKTDTERINAIIKYLGLDK